MTSQLSSTYRPILCVDFDGVIHSYSSGWKSANVVSDPPVPGAIRWLWEAQKHFDVQIYSSRTSQEGGLFAMFEWTRLAALSEFGSEEEAEEFMAGLKFPKEKPAAFLTIDDRAVRFDGDWSDPALKPEVLRSFKPWNKK